MSDPENFLTRWSRRKREAADEPDHPRNEGPQSPASDAPTQEGPVSDASPSLSPPPLPAAGSAPTEPAFDLSTLPSIESITAETDIRAFLQPGVPSEVRLAALRRAWVADPKVKDFVGLNDYDFDFHTPGAIPGFGPLEMTDDLRREVARIVGGWQQESENTAAVPADRQPAADLPPSQPAAAIEEINTPATDPAPAAEDNPTPPLEQAAGDQDELISREAAMQRNNQHDASQHKHSLSENLQTLARRSHGRALPK